MSSPRTLPLEIPETGYSQDAGIGRNALLPPITKTRVTINLKTIKNRTARKSNFVELQQPELKKHSSRLVGGVDMCSRVDAEDPVQGSRLCGRLGAG